MTEENMTDVQREILAAIDSDEIQTETPETLPPEDSPLNQPVIEREFEAPPQPKDETRPVHLGAKEAVLMADSLLGAADNLIEVGGGYFVKVKKSADVLDFEELVQVIEGQNQKNIHRLKLTEEDRAMLRPLLSEVLRKRAFGLTVEEQLLVATCSILIKKAQVIFEIRAENKILLERITEIIRQAKAEEPSPVEAPEPQSEEVSDED